MNIVALKNVVLSFAIALTLSACSTFTGAEHKDNLSQLKTGMTQSRVLSLLGTPDHIVRNGTQDRWTYDFRKDENQGRNVFVQFESGVVEKAGELDGREIAEAKENEVSGSCTRWTRPDFINQSLCRR